MERLVSDEPDAAWRAVYRGGDVDEDRLAELTSAPARYLRVGENAVGRVAPARGWAVLSCIEVAPEARGRGVGAAGMAALVDHALEHVAPVVSRVVSRIGPMLGVAPDSTRDVDLTDLAPLVPQGKSE